MSTEAWAKLIVALVCAFIGLWGVFQTNKYKRSRTAHRRALLDVLSLRQLEELYCEHIAKTLSNAIDSAQGKRGTWDNATPHERKRSADATKRIFWQQLRAQGHRSPSERSTPAAIQQELEKLCD